MEMAPNKFSTTIQASCIFQFIVTMTATFSLELVDQRNVELIMVLDLT